MKTMSKILAVALIASSCLFAGGPFVPEAPEPDVEPVEPAIAEIPNTEPTKEIQPYFGGALGSTSGKVHSEAEVCGGCQYDKLNQTSSKAPDKLLRWGGEDSSASLMGLAGVEINDFLAVEARLTKAVSDFEIKDHKPISFVNGAIYLKPQYKFELGSIYGLIGYGVSKFDFMGKSTTDSGFQYGAGASYNINDETSAFADYTVLHSGGKKISDASTMKTVSNVNVGLIYKP